MLSREIPKLLAQFPSEGTDQHAPTQAVGAALAAAAHNVPQIQQQEPQMQQLTYQEPPPPQPAAPQYQQPYPPQPAAPPAGGAPWAVSPADKARYDEVFQSVGPQNGLVSGAAARPVMEQSGLPVPQLRQIWTLADIDQDGYLDVDEFAVAMHLTREARATPPS